MAVLFVFVEKTQPKSFSPNHHFFVRPPISRKRSTASLGAKILHLEELPDLDLALLAVDGGVGKAPRPFRCLLARFHLDDRVTGDQLLRFGERPVDHGALRSRVLDAPALGA